MNDVTDLDTNCPAYDCDGTDPASTNCVGDDVEETLTLGKGVASGAKLAIFDIHSSSIEGLAALPGSSMWDTTLGTGAMLHTNSWGVDTLCEVSDQSASYDAYMYENPEHLLLFAAGNDGGLKDSTRTVCTIGSPGIGKNVLTVGATSSGATRAPHTGADGRLRYEERGYSDYEPDGFPFSRIDPSLGLPSTTPDVPADIDTVAFYSSYGLTLDIRIKPEVVAPGDQVISASGDGSDESTCMLQYSTGTSMACPAVAGAAALVRQYFTDPAFYIADLIARGLCPSDGGLLCEPVAPSAATVKAMLINSADPMGGSTVPNSLSGFGRVHLEAGMPLNGAGSMALFFTDAATRSIPEQYTHLYQFTLNPSSTDPIEIRATLSWIDPPGSTLAEVQLIHDLDLTVVSPLGVPYRMIVDDDGKQYLDQMNVNERVVVPASDVAAAAAGGVWSVVVTSGSLTTTEQAYSLVVTGPVRYLYVN